MLVKKGFVIPFTSTAMFRASFSFRFRAELFGT